MREIIFRGKRTYNGEWAYGGYYRYSDGRVAILIHGDIGCQHWTEKQQVDPSTVGQYTGLKDKNGKEIYEGDIVKVHDPEETKTPHRSEVKINYDGAYIDSHSAYAQIGLRGTRQLSDYCLQRFSENSYCKIIGNKFNNPELLGGAING